MIEEQLFKETYDEDGTLVNRTKISPTTSSDSVYVDGRILTQILQSMSRMIGDLGTLNTIVKTSLVSAVNESLLRGGGGGSGSVVSIGANNHWYIDGIDTGVSAIGQKGDTGEAGYTPVKGVDYFDGATGPTGPTGATGKTGPAGPKGDSYVLTNADKQEIAAMADASRTTKSLVVTYEDGTTETLNIIVAS